MMRVCRDLQRRAPSAHAPACLGCSGSLRQRRMVSSAACGCGSTCPWTMSPGMALGRACSRPFSIRRSPEELEAVAQRHNG
jgi:hypothetical protein